MRVLIANLPWVNDKEQCGLRAGSRWPHIKIKKEQLPYYPFPFFLAYAAAMLKEAGHQVHLKDCIAEELDGNDFRRYFERIKPEIAVFETSTPSIYNDLAWTKAIKKETSAITVLTGPHASAMPNELLKNGFVDYVIRGEYEGVLLRLVETIARRNNISPVKGLYYRKGKKISEGGWAELIKDLDSLPYPLREQLPVTKYIDPFCKHTPNLQMISSRGCPHQCIFCLESHNYYGGPNYRPRSPKNVVDEIEYLIKNYHVKEIYFDDSSFTINQKRVVEICKEIMKRNLRIFWSCMADSSLSRDTLAK